MVPQVRARGWAAPAANATAACTYVVAVNTDEERPAQFVITLDPPPPASARAAARLFEAGYEVVIGAAGGFTDWIGPGSVNVYGIGSGCKKLPGAPSSG